MLFLAHITKRTIMKSFLSQLRQSLYRSPLYRHLDSNSASRAISYVAVLIALIALAKAIGFGAIFGPMLGDMKNEFERLIDRYPNELVLTIKDGSLSMNRTSPLVIPVEPGNELGKNYKNLVVIDTAKNLDLETYSSYDTMVLITKSGAMYEKDRKVEVQSFKEAPDYVVTKAKAGELKSTVDKFFGKFSAFVIIFMTLFMWIMIAIGGFILALFLSLIGILPALAFSRMRGWKLSFSQLYALALYAYTIVVLLGIVGLFTDFSSWITLVAYLLILAFFPATKPKETLSV